MQKKIKEYRENMNITQYQLAQILGIKQSTVAKWETGLSFPRADKLPELARVLKCTIDELYEQN